MCKDALKVHVKAFSAYIISMALLFITTHVTVCLKFTVLTFNSPFFFSSKKYLTQKNVVEKVSANLSQGKVRFIFLYFASHMVLIKCISILNATQEHFSIGSLSDAGFFSLTI